MDQEKMVDHIDKRLDKLSQQLDFTTIQNAFLAIFFAVFIFVLGTLLFYREENILIWLIALVILPYDLLMLVWLLFSIFSGDVETKYHSFRMVIFFTVWTGSAFLVPLSFLGLIQIPGFAIEVNHITIVIFFLLILVIAIYADRFFERRFDKRFSLLFEEVKKERKPYKGKFELFIKFVRKNRKFISYSATIGLLTSILSGLWEVGSSKAINEYYYGFPLKWIIERSNATIDIEYDYYALFGNILVHAITILVILLLSNIVYKVIRPYFSKSDNTKNKPKKYSQKKNQKIENWENDPAFVKY